MWIIIILAIILIGIYSYYVYKKLIELNDKTNELYKTLDLYFRKRIDFLPSLEKIFSKYNLEKDTIDRINYLLKDDYNKKSVYEKINMNIALNDLLDHLWNVVCSNIIIKQNPIFINIIKQFSVIEAEIVTSKNLYNREIEKYNKLFKYNRLIGLILNFNYKYLYKIDENKRKKLDFENNNKECVVLEDKKEYDAFEKYK